MEQAAIIIRLRLAIGTRKAGEIGLEDKHDDAQADEAETEALGANHDSANQQEQDDAKLPQQHPSDQQREAKQKQQQQQHGGMQ